MSAFDELLDAVSVPVCVACDGPRQAEGAWSRWLCRSCADEVPPHVAPVRRPPETVAAAWALGPYASPIGALVRHGKYRTDAAVLDTLGGVLAEEVRITPEITPVDLVVAVPSSWPRLMWRGLDPVRRLSIPVARALGQTLMPALRRRHRPPQARLEHGERVAASRGVFFAVRPVSGAVLLIDDVCTTGATAAACARELLGAGAASVRLLTVAAVRFS